MGTGYIETWMAASMKGSLTKGPCTAEAYILIGLKTGSKGGMKGSSGMDCLTGEEYARIQRMASTKGFSITVQSTVEG